MSTSTEHVSRATTAIGVADWECKTAIPMLILAAISILLLLADLTIGSDPDFDGSAVVSALVYADIAIMLVFAIEFFYRISMVPHDLRLPYVLAHPIDVLVVLVVGAQPLRLLRSAQALRALRALRAVRVAAMVRKELEAVEDRGCHQGSTRFMGSHRHHRCRRRCLRIRLLRGV